jgi:hypothetical protein
VDRAGINPLPAQQPIPLWIGCGDAPSSLARAGRLADGWIPHPGLGDGDRVRAAWQVVRDEAEKAGRDPGALGMQGQVRFRDTDLAGVAGKLEGWVELGATHVSLNTLEAGYAWPHGHLDICRQVAEIWNRSLHPTAR